jgi:hypothetical protein
MVEAMAAEMQRQVDEDQASTVFCEHDTPGDPLGVVLETLDLEKVARAGLAAIREPGGQALGMAWAGQGEGELLPVEIEAAFAAMIDAITKEEG